MSAWIVLHTLLPDDSQRSVYVNVELVTAYGPVNRAHEEGVGNTTWLTIPHVSEDSTYYVVESCETVQRLIREAAHT